MAQKVDVVLVRHSLRGKGPTYVFGDAGVEMQETTTTTLEEALTDFCRAEVVPQAAKILLEWLAEAEKGV